MTKTLLENIVMFLLILILVFFARQVMADTYIYTGAFSEHLFSSVPNETHNLLAVQHNGYIGGYFENSYGDDTAFAGVDYSAKLSHNIEIGVMAGATYGYRGCFPLDGEGSKRACPMVAPHASYTKYPVQPTVILLGEAVAASIRWEF